MSCGWLLRPLTARLQVLEQVQSLLLAARARFLAHGPVMPLGKSTTNMAGSAKSAGKAAQNVDGVSLNTAFEWLSVEEPTDEALGDDPTVVAVTNHGKAQIQVKPEQRGDDSAFQTWCFLQDLHEIRKTTNAIWIKHRDGEISFMNASMVTETAFGLLRLADEDFQSSRPKIVRIGLIYCGGLASDTHTTVTLWHSSRSRLKTRMSANCPTSMRMPWKFFAPQPICAWMFCALPWTRFDMRTTSLVKEQATASTQLRLKAFLGSEAYYTFSLL